MNRTLPIFFVIASGCAGAASQAPQPAGPATPAPDATPSTAAARPDATACGPDIAGAADVIAPGTIVMLGEIHGTIEMPAFTGNLACRAAVAGHAVIVGLEIVHSEQAAIDRYLASAGTDADREAFASTGHWHIAIQDGRSSKAMFELIESVRRLREQGLAVEVVAFDSGLYGQGSKRDEGMAEILLECVKARPEAFVVALMGNLHNLTVKGTPFDPDMVSMGVHVKAAHPRVISLRGVSEGGTAWICYEPQKCGVQELPGRGEPLYGGLTIDTSEAAHRPGYDGVFYSGPMSASLPVITLAAPQPTAAPAAPSQP